MPPALLAFLKKNAKFMYGTGILGAAFVASDIKKVSDADNKFSALLRIFKDFLTVRIGLVALFTGVSTAMKNLVRDSGSLEAALKKLSLMQVISRQFQGFVGSLDAARKRISEMETLSKRGPFRFEELLEANKALEVFTRGAFSSVEATQEVGQAAIATGNNVADVARAVGAFYDNLRSGQPVAQTADQLRQMGVITQETAEHLESMARSGEDATSVFAELRSAMAITGQSAKGYGDELEAVNLQHEQLVEEMKQKFGAPFAQAEIDNAKNMNAALKAYIPIVEQIAKGSARLYGGFNTVTSSVIRLAAESKLGQKAVIAIATALQALTVAAAGYGIFVGVKLIPTLATLGAAGTRLAGVLSVLGRFAGIATVGLRIAAVGSVVGLIATAVAGLAGAMINMRRETARAQKEFRDWEKAHNDATAALAAQVAAVRTLTDKNEALAKGIRELIALEKELAEVSGEAAKAEQERALAAIRRKAGIPEERKPGEPVPTALPTPDPEYEKTRKQYVEITTRIKELEKERENLNRIPAAPTGPGGPGATPPPIPRPSAIPDEIKRTNADIDREIAEQKKKLAELGKPAALPPGVKPGESRGQRFLETIRGFKGNEPLSEQIRRAVESLGPAPGPSESQQAKTIILRQQIELHKEIIAQLAQEDVLHEKLLAAETERRYAIEEQRKGVEERYKQGKAGIEAEARVEDQRSKIDKDIIERQARLEADRKSFAAAENMSQADRKKKKEEFKKAEQDITDLQAKRLAVGAAGTPETSAVFLRTRAEQFRQARHADVLEAQIKAMEAQGAVVPRATRVEAERARAAAGGVQYNKALAEEAEIKARLAERAEERVPELGAEIPGVQRRRMEEERETALIQARASGDLRKAFKLEDLSRFARTFERLKPEFGEKEAAVMARARTDAEIKEQYAQAGNVVGYLQSIGGGGGLPQAGMDLQRRLLDVAIEQKEYLKQIAQPEQTAAESQGLPAFFFNP